MHKNPDTRVLIVLFDALRPEFVTPALMPNLHAFATNGGTSLSKVFNLIERFSEDIDLILDWRTVTGDNLEGGRSKTKQQALNDQISKEAEKYISESLYPRL